MRKYRLAGTGFAGIDRFYEPFVVDIYSFSSSHDKPAGWPETYGAVKLDTRSVLPNGAVEFEGRQEDSILYRGGVVGTVGASRKRKLVEDLVLILSLLTGQNWCLYCRRSFPDYPVVNSFHLKSVVPGDGGKPVGDAVCQALNAIRSPAWQTQYADGFHLRMLRNHANILSTEARFLALMVIWEWLYAHLKNPCGATQTDEGKGLGKIIASVLAHYWPTKTNTNQLQPHSVLSVMRNQFAHSGWVPIDRKGARPWMKALHCDFGYWTGKGVGIIDYIHFLEQLTQVVVLKTLGLNVEKELGAFSFSDNLNAFLSTGQITHRC